MNWHIIEETPGTGNFSLLPSAMPGERGTSVQMAGVASQTKKGSGTEPGSRVLTLGMHQPSPQLALSRSPPFSSVFMRKSFFLSHRDRNLSSRHGKCQGSCPSFSLNVCQERDKQSIVTGGGWVKEPERLPLAGCAEVWVDQDRNQGIRGRSVLEERSSRCPLKWECLLHFTFMLGLQDRLLTTSLATAIHAVAAEGGGKLSQHLLRASPAALLHLYTLHLKVPRRTSRGCLLSLCWENSTLVVFF